MLCVSMSNECVCLDSGDEMYYDNARPSRTHPLCLANVYKAQ